MKSSGLSEIELGCKSWLLLKQVPLRTHLSFSTFPGSLTPARSQKSSNWPPSPPSILFDKPGRTKHSDTTARDVTLHTQGVKCGFERHREGARESPLYNYTGRRKEVITHFEGAHAPALLLLGHRNTSILRMNSGPRACTFWNSDHTEKSHIWIHMLFSPGLILRTAHYWLLFFVCLFVLIYSFLLAGVLKL